MYSYQHCETWEDLVKQVHNFTNSRHLSRAVAIRALYLEDLEKEVHNFTNSDYVMHPSRYVWYV